MRATLISFVPPHSLAAVLDAAAEALGHDRRCVVARELTKLHEQLFRSTLADAAHHYAATAVKVSQQAPSTCSTDSAVCTSGVTVRNP